MHPAALPSCFIIGGLFICLWLSGCQSAPPTDKSEPLPAATIDWPATGEINLATTAPCDGSPDNCTTFRVSLLKDGLFHWQRDMEGLQQNAMGQWQLHDQSLTLTTHATHSLSLSLDTLGKMYFHRAQLRPTNDSLFDQSVRTLSQISQTNGTIRLAPCPTTRPRPLANNSQSRLLAMLYQQADLSHPSRVLAYLHLDPDRQRFVLDQFISLEPGQCD